MHGEYGQKWLSHLPQHVDRYATQWELTDLIPVNNLSNNYVLTGFRKNKEIVLKISLNKHALANEARALKVFKDGPVVQVLAEQSGALLLEQALPGTPLNERFFFDDDRAIDVLCDIVKQLHQVSLPQLSFQCTRDWLKILDQNWSLPIQYLKKARQLRDQLLVTTKNEVLLHGDLHHGNILLHQKNWVAIDPHGVIGDSVYEVCAFIRNPIVEFSLNPKALFIMQKRVDAIAKNLCIEKQRIYDWSFVQMILAACWSLEDKQDPGTFIKLANMFDGFTP